MAKFLIVGTFATDDPARATLPFIAASGALDRGHEPKIVLMGKGALLKAAAGSRCGYSWTRWSNIPSDF